MSQYLFVYHGGRMPETEEEGAQMMKAWEDWLGGMGDDVVDGGNPVGQSSTVFPDGSVQNNGGTNPASGYSIIKATSDEDAATKAKTCPILAAGGTVELAAIIEM